MIIIITEGNGDITLQLIAEGMPEAAYETVVRGNNAAFAFEGVAAGSYTLRAMKEGHVTREYPITVGVGTEPVNIILYLH